MTCLNTLMTFIYSAIISKSQLRKALEEFTVALTASCLNSEADVFGKCLSAAGSHEYFCCTEKQQAVSHDTQSCGILGSTVKVLIRKVFVLLCPAQGCQCHHSFGNAMLLSPKQIRMFTETKDHMVWYLLVCCIGKVVTFCFSPTCLSSSSVSLFLCNWERWV